MDGDLAEAWGQFLSPFPWDWFCTFTFRVRVEPAWTACGRSDRGHQSDGQVSTFSAHRLFARFMRDVEAASGQPAFWFRGDEYGPAGGRFHIHALVGNVAAERRLYWMDEWNRRAGYARILPFEAGRGAAYYVSKYVVKQFGDWDLSENIAAFRQYQPVLGSARVP